MMAKANMSKMSSGTQENRSPKLPQLFYLIGKSFHKQKAVPFSKYRRELKAKFLKWLTL
jgi:hypothetical protein